MKKYYLLVAILLTTVATVMAQIAPAEQIAIHVAQKVADSLLLNSTQRDNTITLPHIGIPMGEVELSLDKIAGRGFAYSGWSHQNGDGDHASKIQNTMLLKIP